MNQTWRMNKEMSELMARHGVTLAPPSAAPLSDPTEGRMLLSGLAATLDTDSERIQFMFNHTDQCAGRIEQLAHNDRGELVVTAFVDHPMAVRCNAFSVSGDVIDYSLHDINTPDFFAKVGRIRIP